MVKEVSVATWLDLEAEKHSGKTMYMHRYTFSWIQGFWKNEVSKV